MAIWSAQSKMKFFYGKDRNHALDKAFIKIKIKFSILQRLLSSDICHIQIIFLKIHL